MEYKKYLFGYYLKSVKIRPERLSSDYKYFRNEDGKLPINKKLLKEINTQQDHHKYNEIREYINKIYQKIRRRNNEQSIWNNES